MWLFFLIFIFSNLTNLNAALFSIQRPGIYNFGEDLIFNPTIPNDSIVEIKVSNVVVDLGEHTLTQHPLNTQPGINGITVDPDLSNIVIRNGLIANITGTGIIFNEGCSGITLEDIATFSCDVRGIALVGTALQPILRVGMNNVSVNSCCQGLAGDFGMYLQHITGIEAIDLVANSNGSALHNVSGIKLANILLGRFVDVKNIGNIGALSVMGMDLSVVKNCVFEDCFAGSNISLAPGGIAVGYEFRTGSSCTDNILKDCTAFSNTATITGGSAVGFRVRSTNNDNNFFNCFSLENISHGNCFGYFFEDTNDILIINPLSKKNQSIAGLAVGCFVSSCTDLKFLEGIVNEQTSLTSTAVGIDIFHSLESIFRDNIVRRSRGVNDSSSYGFRLTPVGTSLDNTFIRNLSIRNGTGTPLVDNQFFGVSAATQTIIRDQNANAVTEPFTNVGYI